MKNCLKGVLILLVIFFGLFIVKASTDERIEVLEVEVTSNMPVPAYGLEVKNYYTYQTVVGSPAYMTPHMGSWFKKDGGSWHKYTGGVFKEGTYKFSNQIRIDSSDGSTHKLSPSTTLKVDDTSWTITSNISINPTYSMIYYDSPEYNVERIENYELTFIKSDSYYIGSNYVNMAIDSFSVSESVLGGVGGYTFSKTSGPDWIKVSADGTISGTPSVAGSNDNLVVRVTDEASNYKEISISVSETGIDPNDRETVLEVEVTSNMSVPSYGLEVKNYYTYQTVVGSPAYMTPHMGNWFKKDGENWNIYTGNTFVEGTYYFTNQIRIDSEAGKTHKLDDATTLKVDGVSWTLNTVSINPTYSMIYYKSPEYIVVKPNVEKPVLKINSYDNNLVPYWSSQIIATKYQVYRSTNNKKWSKLAETTDTNYLDSKLTYGKKYYYKVRAYDGTNWSGYSNVVSKKVVPNKVNLSIKSASTNNIILSWEKVKVTGYQMQRSTDGKKWSNIKTITKNNILEFNNKKLKANKKYYYRVRAYKKVSGKKIYGPWSNVISTKTAPLKPTVSLKNVNYKSIKFSFKSSKGASYYKTQLSYNKDFKDAETEDFNVASTEVIGGLETGKTIYFRVRACNSENRCSGWSTTSKKVTPASPSLTLKSTITKKVNVKMNITDEYIYGFEIYRSTSKNGKYTKVREITIDTDSSTYEIGEVNEDTFYISFNDKTKKGRRYYYKVRSYEIMEDGKKVYSPYSGIKSIKSK